MRNSERRLPWRLLAVALLAFATAGVLAVAAAGPPAHADAQALRLRRETRLLAMTSQQRIAFGQRMAEWNALPLAEREDRRARYQAWLRLDESERAGLRAVATQMEAFTTERRQALRAQFEALDASQRRGWRLGPALGADYEKLQPLLAYVPAQQQQPMRDALRAMDSAQRADVAVLAQRTPPQERNALRVALLAQPVARRGDWLKGRLDQ